jgi:ADP-ribosylglycohydrolase
MQTTSPRDLLDFEFAQRRQSGYDVSAVRADVEQKLADREASDETLRNSYQSLSETERSTDWQYDEPDDLETILKRLPVSPTTGPVDRARLPDQIRGAWFGRCIGCNLGKPIEWGEHWTPTHIRDYLVRAGAWPLTDYIPKLDPLPPEFDLHDSWPVTTRGNIDGSARDDDIDFAILALHLVETYGTRLTPADVAYEWQLRLPYLATFTAERAAYRNVVNLVPAPRAADVDNPYREWIGAQIRADVFGYVNPGDPRAAATQVFADATLSHRGNGVYAAMWAAALVASAFVAGSARAALTMSLDHVPPRSRLYEAVSDVLDDHASGRSWEETRQRIDERYAGYYWVHAVNNAGVLTAGLLWGDGDFSRSVTQTVVGGLDTDSNGATAGSVAGILAGNDAIPMRWPEPLHDTIHSALAGFDGLAISTLAQRTLAVLASRPA